MRHSKKDFTAAFAMEMVICASVGLPELLLRLYPQLGLNEIEMMVLIQLIRWIQVNGDAFPGPDKLQENMTLDSEAVKNTLAGLMEKKLLAVVPRYNDKKSDWENSYSLEPLFEKLAEVWACEKAKQFQSRQEFPEKVQSFQPGNHGTEELRNLYKTFEKEFGRLLSPMEGAKLDEWYRVEGFSRELIAEALKRAVLRGILNFKYIDSILRDWNKNNVRTVKEAMLYEERFIQRRGRRPLTNGGAGEKPEPSPGKGNPRGKKDKYEDVYLS